MKTVFLMIFLAVSVVSAGAAPLDRQALITKALETNPELASLAERVKAAEAMVSPAQALPDPKLTFRYENETLNEVTYGESAGTKLTTIYSQEFPLGGKREYKGAVLRESAVQMRYDTEAAERLVVRRIKETIADILVVEKSITTLDDWTTLLKKLEEQAIARYSSGISSQSEVVAAQQQKYMIMEKKQMAEQKLAMLNARLSLLVGIESPVKKGSVLPRKSFKLPKVEKLIETAYTSAPQLAALRARSEATRFGVQAAQAESVPNLMVGVMYTDRGSFDPMWGLEVGFTLPVYGSKKQSFMVQEAKNREVAATRDIEMKRVTIAAEIRELHAVAESALNLIRIYDSGLLRKNMQEVESAIAGYRNGKESALMIIARLNTVLDLDIRKWEQTAQFERAVAGIEMYTDTLSTLSHR